MTSTPRDDAGRSHDRTLAAAILDRLDRGKQLIPGEAAVLRAVLAAEQAEADQAREQLAAARAGDAPWIKAYREDIEQARRGETEAVRARKADDQPTECPCPPGSSCCKAEPAEPARQPLVISIDLSGPAIADAIRRAARFGEPASTERRGIDLAGYTAGTQAFMTAYARSVAPALDQIARALGVTRSPGGPR